MRKVLVTGGAGYIGSHSCISLLANGFDVYIYDNSSTDIQRTLKNIEIISKCKVNLIQGDIRDKRFLEDLFSKIQFDGVIHFAALKSINESIQNPLEYYDCNISGTINLLEVMAKFSVFKIIFSSSASVYGEPKDIPIQEHFPLQPTNPYAQTKMLAEKILNCLYISNNNWQITSLRYFNPIGAHESGLIGALPADIPSNLLPFITQVAIKKQKQLTIYGNDYPTRDGTGIRDYIHVIDIAEAHVLAYKHLTKINEPLILNLGTGQGTSVLEMVQVFEEATNTRIPYVFAPRRPGDIGECWADPSKAKSILNWQAKKNLQTMCEDSWRWQKNLS